MGRKVGAELEVSAPLATVVTVVVTSVAAENTVSPGGEGRAVDCVAPV